MEINLSDLLNNNAIDPIQYQYFKNLENRRIIINDEISSNILEMAILPLIEMDNDGSGKPIEILLNSLGGEVYSGGALIDVIEKIKTPLTIKIIGTAASMAVLIAIAGKNNKNVKTTCSYFSVGLIHSGSLYLGQINTNAAKDMFHFNDKYEKRIRDYIISNTKIDEEMYDKIERQEFWMDSDDMLKYGIVDEIV